METSVYHKQAAEPYIVPFKSDHPRHVFNNIIDVALTRALRYSSTLAAFNVERCSIKLILLYNGLVILFIFLLVLLCSLFSDSYPPRYIHNRFMKFLTNNLRISSIIPLLETENDFIFIRSHLLYTPTPIEQQIATRITKTIDSLDHDTTNNPLVRLRLKTKSKWIDNLIIHYVHEERLTSYKKHIHQLWDQIFKDTPAMNTKLIVSNRNSPNAIQTLVRRRSHQKL